MTSKYDEYVAAHAAEQAADDTYSNCEHGAEDDCGHRRAYYAAVAATRAAAAAWRHSDEPREYEFGDEAGACGHCQTCRPSELDDILRDWIADGDYTHDRTIRVAGHAWQTDPVTGETEHVTRVSATIQPAEPDCADGHDHKWQQYGETQGRGGGVLYTEICMHCGLLQHVDTWGDCHGMIVRYDAGNHEACVWLERRLQRAFVDRVAAATSHLDGVRLQDAGDGVVYVWCDDAAPVFGDGLQASFDGVKYICDR